MTKPNSIKNLVFNNPLLRRYRYSLLRPGQFWIYMTIYIIIVFLFLFVNYNINQLKNDTVIYEELFNDLYYQFTSLLLIILCFWAPLNSRSALRQEIFDKTYDFFRLLPLSALQKTIGVIVGRNLLAFLLAAMTFVPVLVFGILILEKISGFFQFQVIFVLLSSAIFLNSAALLSFSTAPGRKKKTSIGIWIILFILFGPVLIHLLFLPFYAMYKLPVAEDIKIEFYGLDFHLLIFISLVMLYYGFWNIIGILRKFTYENEPLFNRIGAVIFFLGYQLLALGLFLPHLSTFGTAVDCFWIATLPPLLLIPLGSVKSFEDYLESCGSAASLNPYKSSGLALFKNSNLTLAFILFVIWLCFSLFAAIKGQLSPSEFLPNLAVVFSFCLFLILLLELYVVYRPVLNKIGLLLGFFTALYFFIPILLALTLQAPSLRFYSLLGFFAHLLNPLAGEGVAPRAFICIVNAILCLAPILLIAQRYSNILTLKKHD